MRKIIFGTIENDWPGNNPKIYRSSKEIFRKINNMNTVDLYLIMPDDFNDDLSVKYIYKLDNKNLNKINSENLVKLDFENIVPKGDTFIIFGDNSRKEGHTLESANRMYDYLINLENSGNFKKMVNKPLAEKYTLKTSLPELSSKFDFITKTYSFNSKYDLENKLKSTDLIMKAALSCGGLGVSKISKNSSLYDINLNDFVFQEILPIGLETRIVIPGDPKKVFGRAHVGSIYDPNNEMSILKTIEYIPHSDEIEKLNEIKNYIGANILSVDCLGFGKGNYFGFEGDKNFLERYLKKDLSEKIYTHDLKAIELNGTGTGSIMYDPETNKKIYDNSDLMIKEILK